MICARFPATQPIRASSRCRPKSKALKSTRSSLTAFFFTDFPDFEHKKSPQQGAAKNGGKLGADIQLLSDHFFKRFFSAGEDAVIEFLRLGLGHLPFFEQEADQVENP